MVMDNTDTRALRKARAVAKKVTRIHNGIVEYDDVLSECFVWMVKNQHKVDEWLGEGNVGMAKLGTSLYRAGQRYAVRERQKRTGTLPGDHYFYTPATVEAVLPLVWDYDDWTYGQGQPGEDVKRRSKAPSEGGDMTAMIVDVKWAVASLPADEQVLLRDRYEANGMEMSLLAYRNEMSERGMRKKMDRVLSKLCDRLGGEPPWWTGGRKAKSNARAQSETRNNDG